MKYNDPNVLPYSTILSPTLYSIYLNEIEKVSEYSSFIGNYKKYIMKRLCLGLENIDHKTEELIVDSDIYTKTGSQVSKVYFLILNI